MQSNGYWRLVYLGTLSSTKILREVLYIPDSQRHLLSISRLVDLSLFVGFDHTNCRIEKDCTSIAVAPRHGNLFELSLNEDVANVVTAQRDLNYKLWHHQFARSNFSKLLDIHHHDLVREALDTFKRYQISVENHIGLRIKILRSDNGGEYISNLFHDHCINHGIHHEYTIPYSPQ